MPFRIAVESPLQDDIRVLIAELNAYLLSIFPPEACSHMTVEQMNQPDTTVFIARDDHGHPVACGALRRHADGIGEVKRMFTRPAFQGRGLGGRMVALIEDLARREGFSHLVLETGLGLEAAWHVYERAGFTRCGPVLTYPDIPTSVFYEKSLQDSDLGDRKPDRTAQ
jgi:putative acetyltransferase